ncbi:MAG: hypothetical protein PHD86_00480 [Kiritimatiellae bacterium]|nr:hypothetical protein [Kiritimatiellia bacterium]
MNISKVCITLLVVLCIQNHGKAFGITNNPSEHRKGNLTREQTFQRFQELNSKAMGSLPKNEQLRLLELIHTPASKLTQDQYAEKIKYAEKCVALLSPSEQIEIEELGYALQRFAEEQPPSALDVSANAMNSRPGDQKAFMAETELFIKGRLDKLADDPVRQQKSRRYAELFLKAISLLPQEERVQYDWLSAIPYSELSDPDYDKRLVATKGLMVGLTNLDQSEMLSLTADLWKSKIELPPYCPPITENNILDLSSTYGFYKGHQQTSKVLVERFPHLKAEVMKAQADYDRRFESSFITISNLLRKTYHLFPSLEKEVDKVVGAASDASSAITEYDAMECLKILKERAGGKLDSPFLETLLIYNPRYMRQPTLEYSDGYVQAFQTQGLLKALGLNIQVEYPKSWKGVDGKRPHVVQVFTSENGMGMESIVLLVKDVFELGDTLTRKELNALFSAQSLKKLIPSDAEVISTHRCLLDRQQGGLIVYKHTAQRLDLMIKRICMDYVTIYDGKMITIQCSVGGVDVDNASLTEQFGRYRTLFQLVANSFVIQNQY